jgi:hypothetical protein
VSGDETAATPAGAGREPPVRPAVRTGVPSPLLDFAVPRPRALTFAVLVWLGSCLVGAVIVGYLAWRLDAVREIVGNAVREDDSTTSSSTLRRTVDITIALSLGSMVIAVALKLVLALVMAYQHRWARVLLAIIGVLTAPVPTIAATVLTAGTLETRRWLLLALATQEVLMVIGLVTMFLPSATRWMRLRLLP